MSKALDASLVDTESSGTESEKQDTSSRLGNYAYADDADIKLHAEQPDLNNKGRVDHDAEQCHDICPLPAKFTNNQITELSNQSLESENNCLKKTVTQFQKDYLRMEAHCIALEFKYQNQALKSGQHGQFSKVKSNEAMIKHDINEIETINIELEQSVAKLLTENEHLNKENEHLKNTYKDLYDSIKKTRVQTKDQNGSLIEQLNKTFIKNADLKAQIQEMIFANAILKNETQSLVAEKTDISETKGTRNSNLITMTNDVELETLDHRNEPSSSTLVPNVSPSADADTPSLQELDFLFSPLFEEYFTARNLSVSKSSVLSNNSKQQDTHPTVNVQSIIELITPTKTVTAEENNTDIQEEIQV
ncbi:hypothetical protein Tco_0784478 [Tanacetum coccineum]